MASLKHRGSRVIRQAERYHELARQVVTDAQPTPYLHFALKN